MSAPKLPQIRPKPSPDVVAQIPTNHPFKKILGLAYYDMTTTTEEIMAPGGGSITPQQQGGTVGNFQIGSQEAGDAEWGYIGGSRVWLMGQSHASPIEGGVV